MFTNLNVVFKVYSESHYLLYTSILSLIYCKPISRIMETRIYLPLENKRGMEDLLKVVKSAPKFLVIIDFSSGFNTRKRGFIIYAAENYPSKKENVEKKCCCLLLLLFLLNRQKSNSKQFRSILSILTVLKIRFFLKFRIGILELFASCAFSKRRCS